MDIRYIKGIKNRITNALLRIIFPDKAYNDNKAFFYFGNLFFYKKWVWKDGKEGYNELLIALNAL